MERIELEKLFNTRDLGGIPTTDGRHIRKGRLLRSGQLWGATARDISTLINEYKLARIVDFRTETERREKPDPQIDGVTYTANPVFREEMLGMTRDTRSDMDTLTAMMTASDRGSADPRAFMVSMYRSVASMEYSQQQYRRFFDILLAAESGATLWHCSAGKDRVGIATALLLTVLGVDRDTIAEDYLLTGRYVRITIDLVLAKVKDRYDRDDLDQCISAFLGVHRDYLEAFFGEACQISGDTGAYLRDKIGIGDDEQRRLKDMYLE